MSIYTQIGRPIRVYTHMGLSHTRMELSHMHAYGTSHIYSHIYSYGTSHTRMGQSHAYICIQCIAIYEYCMAMQWTVPYVHKMKCFALAIAILVP